LAPELALLKTLLREPIANRTVTLEHLPTAKVAEHCADLARHSQCCCLGMAVDPPPLEARDVEVASLRIDGPRPVLTGADAEQAVFEADDAFDAWATVLERLLRSWV
jgi:hypothetical protein